jgi:hypothetical protein
MSVSINLAAFHQTSAREYAIRFFFGGLVTAMAGIVAEKWGPGVGGLFLAFPAIFPASATLLETHQHEKKQRIGLSGRRRGRNAVALDAAGAAQGGLGLLAFSLVVWACIQLRHPWLVILLGAATWVGVSFSIWRARRLPRRLCQALRKPHGPYQR